ncbi:MAG: DUF4381 domain-containing protein [Cognaticolwellia sp.]
MDPLAQLKDIHLPADVHNYPVAPGWWLLMAAVLALIIFGLIKWRHYVVKRKAKKNALKQLASATDNSATVALLKWAALQYFPRQQVAHLTGDNFKAFLIASLAAKQQEKFTQLSAEHFNSVYQNNVEKNQSEEFSQAAALWLKHALPPKKASLAATQGSDTQALASQTIASQAHVAQESGAKL